MKEVKAHAEFRTLKDFVIDPDHASRTESEVFSKAKERLKEDGHYQCFICGATVNLQVHHFAVEYMFENIANLTKVKEFVESFDPYGYGHLLRQQPLLSVEDVRCLLVLCQPHHTGVDHADGGTGTGIHSLTFPSWIIQKLCVDGADPVPQSGETGEQALERVEKNEVKEG